LTNTSNNIQEEALGAGGKAKAGGMAAKQAKKTKKKGKGGDLSFLEDSLVSGAEKKLKKKKEAEKAKKEKEEADRIAKLSKETESGAIDFCNGITDLVSDLNLDNHTNINRELNIDEVGQSGIDGANSIFNFGGPPDKNPKLKAAHKEFEAKMLPQYREDYPGLKLSQLKEKIFEAFQKSPDNPKNQQT